MYSNQKTTVNEILAEFSKSRVNEIEYNLKSKNKNADSRNYVDIDGNIQLLDNVYK